MKSIVLKEWMRIVLSICLLGLPVILGYFSIQIAEARNTEIAKDSLAPALDSEFDFPRSTGVARGKSHTSQMLQLRDFQREPRRSATASLTKALPEISGWHEDAPRNQHSSSNAENQLSVAFINSAALFASGQMLPASVAHLSELFPGFTFHKNGRLIDTASYLHSTIR